MNTTKSKVLLLCGAIAGPLFIILFLIEGATRADYNPIRHPVSSLSIGDMGWTQMANFLITGLLFIAFAFGLRRALRSSGSAFWGPLLIGIVGIGLLGAGIFTTDPLNGYPPSTPLVPTVRTQHGMLHDYFSLPVFLGLPIAGFVMSRAFFKRGERGWAIYSILSGLGLFGAFVVAGLGFRQTPGYPEIAGLFQRISLSIGWIWIALMAVHFLRAPDPQPIKRA